MGFFDWFHAEPEPDPFKQVEAMMRQEDPDYDERKRLRSEQIALTKRRDFLAMREKNAALQAEIAELERRDGAPLRDGPQFPVQIEAEPRVGQGGGVDWAGPKPPPSDRPLPQFDTIFRRKRRDR